MPGRQHDHRVAWAALAVACLVGCGGDARSTGDAPAKPPVATSVPVATASGPATPPVPPPPPPGPPKRLFAKKFVAQVRSAPDKDAPRIGYLRGGAVLLAKTSASIGYAACRKGWYELETGGFVCSTVDFIAFDGERLPERRPLQPDLGARMPYPFGYSRRKGTPVFRSLPTREEALLYVDGVVPAPSPSDAPTDEGATDTTKGASAPSANAPDSTALAAGAEGAPPPAAGMPGAGALASPDGGVPTLASLQGEEGTVLLRRMERGFYVSLDEQMERDGRRYWRTQNNGFIPFDRLVPVEATAFRGVNLAPDAMQLPLGFLLSSRTWAQRLDDRGRLRKDTMPGYHYVFSITGEAEIHGTKFLVADDGRHFRVKDATRVDAREKPREVGDDEKWIDVDLTTQALVAYVGSQPVFVTLVSTGRVEEKDDPLEDHATPTGSFRVTSKHLSASMDGDHAIDGPYSIEDVPYVMYFELAYALHAAFWHNGFGRPRSHGCVNLAPEDARWLFAWADPALPASWHGVYPDAEHSGTRLYIHGETPDQ